MTVLLSVRSIGADVASLKVFEDVGSVRDLREGIELVAGGERALFPHIDIVKIEVLL